MNDSLTYRNQFALMAPKSSEEVLEHIKETLKCDDKRANSVFSQIRKPHRYILHYRHGSKTWVGVDHWNMICNWDGVVSYANDKLGAEYGVWSGNLGELRTMGCRNEGPAIRALISAIGCGKVSPAKARKLFREFSRPLYLLMRYDPETHLWCGWLMPKKEVL